MGKNKLHPFVGGIPRMHGKSLCCLFRQLECRTRWSELKHTQKILQETRIRCTESLIPQAIMYQGSCLAHPTLRHLFSPPIFVSSRITRTAGDCCVMDQKWQRAVKRIQPGHDKLWTGETHCWAGKRFQSPSIKSQDKKSMESNDFYRISYT
jgi:hypothetical protein